MKYFTILILLVVNSFCYGQKIQIKVISTTGIVPYVTIIKNNQTVVGYTAADGTISLTDYGDFNTSHVSYQNEYFHINKPMADTLINIELTNKSTDLENIVITSAVKHSKKYKTVGYNAIKFNAGILLKNSFSTQKTMLGVKMPSLNTDEKHYLRSICFRLSSLNFTKKDSFVVELKLFKILNNKIDTTPFNKKPLYINSYDLAKNNEVFINENIVYPAEGFIITVPIPKLAYSNISLSFAGNWLNKQAVLLVKNNTNDKWDIDALNKPHTLKNFSTDKYVNLAFTTTYYKN